MQTRQPCAPQFYSGGIGPQMEGYKKGFVPPDFPKKVVAGIVPHAGWFFSGRTAAKVFLTVKARQRPSTFVLFGAVHVPGVRTNSVYPDGSWDTPLGPVSVDSGLAGTVIKELPELVSPDPRAHMSEHSIEVQLPMIKYLFPDARIVPVAVPPSSEAVEFGGGVGRIIRDTGQDAVVIASTDLTHYGDNYGYTPAGYGRDAYEWMVENDSHILELARTMRPSEIITEAAVMHNACGAGAMAAAVAAARAMGAAAGHLIEHTTSYDVYPEGEFEMAVGYAAMVF